MVSLQNLDRTHAFDEADQRLLTMLAGSLSVALENARLVPRARQRNAELALINSVQRGLAENLGLQAQPTISWAIDIQESSTRRSSTSRSWIGPTGLVHFPYSIERGVRYPDEVFDPRRGSAA